MRKENGKEGGGTAMVSPPSIVKTNFDLGGEMGVSGAHFSPVNRGKERNPLVSFALSIQTGP